MGKIFNKYISKPLKYVAAIGALTGVGLGMYTCDVQEERRRQAELKECQRLSEQISESIRKIKEGGPVYPNGGYYLIVPNDYWTPFSFMDELLDEVKDAPENNK